MRALVTLGLRQMLGGRKIWVLGVFLALPIVLIGLVLLAGGFDFPDEAPPELEDFVMSALLYVLYPQSLCVLAALLYGASLIAGEVEDKTLTYLFTRGMPRWKVLVGKYLATSSALAVLMLASMSIAWLLVGRPVGVRVWYAVALATTGACFTFTGIFCLLGLIVPRRAIPVGLLYTLAVEGFLSVVPAIVNELTASYYLRSLTWHLADLPIPADARAEIEREVEPFVAGADVQTASIALAVIAVGTLALSAWIIHRREWPLTEGV